MEAVTDLDAEVILAGFQFEFVFGLPVTPVEDPVLLGVGRRSGDSLVVVEIHLPALAPVLDPERPDNVAVVVPDRTPTAWR